MTTLILGAMLAGALPALILGGLAVHFMYQRRERITRAGMAVEHPKEWHRIKEGPGWI